MDRNQLLKRLDKAWQSFLESYSGLTNAQLLIGGVTGKWSVRDIVAHVTTWEAEALQHLPEILRGIRPPRYSLTYGGIDTFNAIMTERKNGLSPEEVFWQMAETHRRLVNFLETVPERNFQTETRFRRRLRLDTYGHYPKHARAIRQWREQVPSFLSPKGSCFDHSTNLQLESQLE